MIPASDGAAISLVGDITWQSSEMLRDRIASLIDQGRRNIVISLSDVSYVDSSGLAVLLSAFRRLHLLKGRLILKDVQPQVMRALQQARICDLIPAFGRDATCHDRILTDPSQPPQMVRSMSIPGDPSRMGETRAKVSQFLGSLGLPDNETFDLTLAFGEALGNAFDHGAGEESGDITVTARLYADRVVMEVSDCGCGCSFNEGDELPVPTETRGRGIRLMMMLADGVSIQPKENGPGTVVRLVKLLNVPADMSCEG